MMINFHCVPEDLNVGLLIPIIKNPKEKNNTIENIRPILSDCLAIIFEKFNLKQLEKNFIEDDQQFGFRYSYSTNTVIHYKTKRKPVYCCFLDFSKAFDKINRNYLFDKLSDIMEGNHWLTLKKYYDKSKICIKNNNQMS